MLPWQGRWLEHGGFCASTPPPLPKPFDLPGDAAARAPKPSDVEQLDPKTGPLVVQDPNTGADVELVLVAGFSGVDSPNPNVVEVTPNADPNVVEVGFAPPKENPPPEGAPKVVDGDVVVFVNVPPS